MKEIELPKTPPSPGKPGTPSKGRQPCGIVSSLGGGARLRAEEDVCYRLFEQPGINIHLHQNPSVLSISSNDHFNAYALIMFF